MNILMTGATGFIGSALKGKLVEAGHVVSALTSSPAKMTDSAFDRVHLWADPSRVFPPAQAFEGMDAVIHLAGESVSGRWTSQKKRAIRESRVLGTRNLVRLLSGLSRKPEVLISASAIGFYGDRGDELLTEDSDGGSDFLSEVCREWEAEAGRAAEAGIRTVQLRSGIVLGSGGALSAMLPTSRWGLGGPLGSGRQWWSWVHLEDVAGIMLHVLNNKTLTGCINATSPNPVTQREFAKVLGRVLRRPAFLPAPALALKLILGEFSSELLSSKRVLPAKALNSGFNFRFSQLEPALRQILGP